MVAPILEVPSLEKAIESVQANGGTLMRPAAKSGDGLRYAFLKDPDGNQIELVEATKSPSTVGSAPGRAARTVGVREARLSAS